MITMDMLDIHTHLSRDEAIINCSPFSFSPVEGRFYSVGIHPWKVSEDYQGEWDLLQKIASHPQVIVIGEAGLDKLAIADMSLQLEVLNLQIDLSEQLKKPLIIHSVHTSNELIRLKKQLKPLMSWVIHGFRGNGNVALQLSKEGFYLSFGEKYRMESLVDTPINRVLIETDESGEDIHALCRQAAKYLSLPDNQFVSQIRQNIKEVFFSH